MLSFRNYFSPTTLRFEFGLGKAVRRFDSRENLQGLYKQNIASDITADVATAEPVEHEPPQSQLVAEKHLASPESLHKIYKRGSMSSDCTVLESLSSASAFGSPLDSKRSSHDIGKKRLQVTLNLAKTVNSNASYLNSS
jgi:hypothetical protein